MIIEQRMSMRGINMKDSTRIRELLDIAENELEDLEFTLLVLEGLPEIQDFPVAQIENRVNNMLRITNFIAKEIDVIERLIK